MRKIKVEEKGGNLFVSGPYNKMKAITTKLKSYGFKYDGFLKAWYIPLSKVTSSRRKDIEQVVLEANGGGSKIEDKSTQALQRKMQEDRDREEQEERKVKELLGRLYRTKFLGISVENDPWNLTIQGYLEDVKKALEGLGARKSFSTTWAFSSAWIFTIKNLTQDTVEKIGDLLESQGNRNAVRAAASKKALGEPREWPAIKVSMIFPAPFVALFRGDGVSSFSQDLKAKLYAQRRASGWEVNLIEVTPSDAKQFIQMLEAASKAPPTPAKKAPTDSRRTNQRGDFCAECGVFVKPGEGYIFQEYDDIKDDLVWKVHHKDNGVCKENDRLGLRRIQQTGNKSEARRRLSQVATSRGSYHFVNGPIPGKVIPLEVSSNGMGVWVILEPDGKHFWYIDGNLADGVPGGIGYRCPLTPEVEVYLNVIQK